jgi:hypothetical protein
MALSVFLAMSDTPFLKRILLACSRGSARLFRNNNGVGWVGKSVRIDKPGPVHLNAGDVVIRAARPLHAGLIGGSGDLIGWRSFVIQPEDKEGTGRMSPEQRNFRDQVLAAGGIAGEVRSVEDAERLLAGE